MGLNTDSDRIISKLSSTYGISPHILKEYYDLFRENGIPIALKRAEFVWSAKRIIMVSTHGYWGDPPPAGVPDTGGQTYYVLETSKAWARQGRKVIILARWFKPFPQVEKFAKNVWIVRIKVGGDRFVRKEDIYPLVPQMAEAATAVSVLFGAQAVLGHYADGMVGALEVAERLEIPCVNILHSLGVRKVKTLGYDPYDPETWFDPQYNFWVRESFELAGLRGANLEIANTPREPEMLKQYYHLEFPHHVMPAGAGREFFDAYSKDPDTSVVEKFGLTPKKYLIFFGRLSEAKNIRGVVAVLGEARKINPAIFGKVRLAIVGGAVEKPSEEEKRVREAIGLMMKKYGLAEGDVRQIPGQGWPVLSVLVRYALFYVGMQMMEPFGMAVAEAMAAGVPVMISKAAGITKWFKMGEDAIIVDPTRPDIAARKLVHAVKDKIELKRLTMNSRRLAKAVFSWEGIARRLGAFVDNLCRGHVPKVDNHKGSFLKVFRMRKGRAYHRQAFVWRGDPPVVKDVHKKAAGGLVPHVLDAVQKARQSGKRVVLGLGGESGAGKTEVAEYLRFCLRRDGVRSVTIGGDVFFRRAPANNHKARLKAYGEGRLAEYIGPGEVNLEKLDEVLEDCLNSKNKKIYVPSDCRTLGSRRYERVPVDIAGTDLIIVDLTYSLLLKNVALKVFFESDYKKRVVEIKERNLARDPNQDFDFILKVLEIEHGIITGLKDQANIIIDSQYDVMRPVET